MPHFPQALLGSLSFNAFEKSGKALQRKAAKGDGEE
jgi:hypothetical protein